MAPFTSTVANALPVKMLRFTLKPLDKSGRSVTPDTTLAPNLAAARALMASQSPDFGKITTTEFSCWMAAASKEAYAIAFSLASSAASACNTFAAPYAPAWANSPALAVPMARAVAVVPVAFATSVP